MKNMISFIFGLMFGTGLILTGMYSPDVILSGLKIGAATFRIDLYVTFISALVVTFLLYQLRRWIKKPFMNPKYDFPTMDTIDWKLIVGAALFGMGWGISGICPGPNLVGLGILTWPFYWIHFAGILTGFFIIRTALNRIRS